MIGKNALINGICFTPNGPNGPTPEVKPNGLLYGCFENFLVETPAFGRSDKKMFHTRWVRLKIGKVERRVGRVRRRVKRIGGMVGKV